MAARYNISLICSWIIAPALLHLARESVLYARFSSLVERTTQLRTTRLTHDATHLQMRCVLAASFIRHLLIENESKNVGSSLDGEEQ